MKMDVWKMGSWWSCLGCWLHFKSCKDAGFYCFFFFFVELQENILQRYHAEIVDLIKKTTGARSICSVFVAIFFCGKTGVQVPNMWFPLTTTSDPQLANPVRRRSRCAFYKTVSCWTGVTNNCSNNCRVEPKFNLLEAKCVFLFDVRSVFFLIFLFLCSRAGPQWLHHHRWLVLKKGCLSISFRWSNDRFLWQPNLRKNTSGGPMRYEQLSQPPKVNDSIKKEGMKPTIPEVEGFFCWVFAVRSCRFLLLTLFFALFFAHELAILAGSVWSAFAAEI